MHSGPREKVARYRSMFIVFVACNLTATLSLLLVPVMSDDSLSIGSSSSLLELSQSTGGSRVSSKSGRPRDHPVWDYFSYDEATNTSRCLCTKTEAGDTPCEYAPKGRHHCLVGGVLMLSQGCLPLESYCLFL